ncbi:hypothetical protein HMPREF1531_01878 [Propionibacterium sp. oral taxon 192 str. F0372]|uniref:DUF4191 domain-containing protein n=1 Tax=Propionibacterium sp. oral taxon 192 TaxID=671222 RepID=UPI0003536EAC|nr:DUF4191 domain-containing protein [Propionibacterium sp. oral taxon 192]EPH02570.1 hypothetical protein HMPREF1531_01878 [Propionibacterium sp. oral taxon 192 str. F0372]
MAKSERAKELAAKQKAEAKALRAAKKNSDNPRDWGIVKQVRESYRLTREVDPQLNLWLVGSFIVAAALIAGLSTLTGARWWMSLIMALLFGFTAALFMLTRRTRTGTYLRYKGTPGAGEVPLSMLNNKKWTVTPAIAFTRQQDCIHRVVGAPGVVLIGDGNPSRLRPLLNSELKRHQAVLYGITVEAIQMGEGEGMVPMEKLTKHIESLPKAIDKVEQEEVISRLRALDNMKGRMPIPKGPMPTNMKGARKAMRGR